MRALVKSAQGVGQMSPANAPIVTEQHTNACDSCCHRLIENASACKSKRTPGYFTNGALAQFSKMPDWLLNR